MVTRNEYVAYLKSFVGTYGPPNNSNIFNDWYYGRHVSGDAYSWCVVFACYGMDHFGILAANGGKFAGVPSFEAHYSAVGSYVGNPTSTKLFEPGDPIAYDLNGNGGGDHFGTVYRVISATEFEAIEGNTSGKGNDDVAIKTRSVHQVIGHAKLLGVTASAVVEEDDFMGDYVSIDKNDKSRQEQLVNGKWTSVYFNKNNSAAAKKNKSEGDYPSIVQGGQYYTGVVNLRISGVPQGAEGQVRTFYVDAKDARQASCYISEFVGSDGDTFVTHPANGYVPTGQKMRVEVISYAPNVTPKVIEGQVRLFVKGN